MTTATAPASLEGTSRLQRSSLPGLIRREAQRRHKRRLLAVLVLLAVPALALASWVYLRPAPPPLTARFRMAHVSRGDITREVHATGHLEAITTVQIGAEISGRIESVEVDHNDNVRAGQVLARFDRSSLAAQRAQTHATLAAARAAVEQAKIDRDRAARDRDRAEALFKSALVSESERDSVASTARVAEQRLTAAKAQVNAQEASYALAKTNLDHTLIRSPIDGVVITRNVDPGQTVTSMLQTPVLFTVAADLRRMRVIAAVDEADVGEVAVKQPAKFTVNAYPSRTFEGTVVEVRSSAEIVQDVVTYGTEVELDNFDLALKPGMTATVRIRTATAKDVLRVPAAALQFTPPGEKPKAETGVWVLATGALKHIAVTPSISDGELTSVAPGAVAPGDEVVYELTPEGRKAYGIQH